MCLQEQNRTYRAWLTPVTAAMKVSVKAALSASGTASTAICTMLCKGTHVNADCPDLRTEALTAYAAYSAISLKREAAASSKPASLHSFSMPPWDSNRELSVSSCYIEPLAFKSGAQGILPAMGAISY